MSTFVANSSANADTKERIRQAIDLVELIGGYLDLKRAGQNFVGLCPFHPDRKPSLNVHPVKQIWRCFVCGAGGDAFSFIMKRENLGFREALEFLADKTGIKLEPSARSSSDKSGERKAIYEVLAWAETQFRECLENQPASDPGRAYFDKRRITAESRARFHLGFAPNEWHWLSSRALAKGFSPELLVAAGLMRRKENSDRGYDFYRGRVMFPIRDARKRTIAFGGRILPQFDDGTAGKYLNSSESPVFQKHREVYGLDVAGEGIVHSRRTAVLVEGYTDVIMAHQFGLTNVVAALGTSVTAEHIAQRSVLRRYADTIVLLLDGDNAGQNKAASLVKMFVAEDADLRIASLSGGLDPCDFLLAHGAEALREIIASSVDALEHHMRAVRIGLDLDHDTFAAAKALESILSVLALTPQNNSGGAIAAARLREQQVLVRLAREFHVEETMLRARLVEIRRSIKPQRERISAPQKPSGVKTPSPQLDEPLPTLSAFDLAAAEAAMEAAGDSYEPLPEELIAAQPASDPNRPLQVAELDAKDAEFLELLTQYPLLAGAALGRVELDLLAPGPARMIYLTYHRLVQSGQSPELSLVMSALEDERLKALLAELDERGAMKNERATCPVEDRLDDLVLAFHQSRERSEFQVKSTILHAAETEPSRKTELFLDLLSQKRRAFTT